MPKWVMQKEDLSSCWSGMAILYFLCLVWLICWMQWLSRYFFSPMCTLQQVVIMLVIDKENDRVLLSRQSRFVPRMWSCLAGFIEVCVLGSFNSTRTCFEANIKNANITVVYKMEPWWPGSILFFILFYIFFNFIFLSLRILGTQSSPRSCTCSLLQSKHLCIHCINWMISILY